MEVEESVSLISSQGDMELRLIYLVKVLRMKKAYYLLDTSKFKKIVFQYYQRKRNYEMAIMKE